jgi:anti-sigma factor RsiW
MSIDENTILSAYLDRQLDLDQERLVESALATDAGLAEELRALTLVHEMVSGLPRDNSVDVSSRVMERILGRNNAPEGVRAPAAQIKRHRRRLAVTGWLTAAAALLIATTLAMVHTNRVRGRGINGHRANQASVAGATLGSTIVTPASVATTSGSPAQPASGNSNRSDHSSSGPVKPVGDGGIGLAAAGGRPLDSDLQDVRQLLDDPSLRRFFFVRNSRDGKVEQQVATVVEKTVHHGYFKMTISQGLVIDPRHPDEATVFTLVVNPGELDDLRNQLQIALADQVEERPADPRVVTQLADVGPVELARPASPAAVSIPGERLAFSTPHAGTTDDGVATPVPARSRAPTDEQYRSAPIPRPGSRSPATDSNYGKRRDAAKPAESVVVVWVYKPRADELSAP